MIREMGWFENNWDTLLQCILLVLAMAILLWIYFRRPRPCGPRTREVTNDEVFMVSTPEFAG